LCLQPSHVGGIVRAPQPINEGARASSASLSITIRVASITPSPHQSCRTLHGCRRTGFSQRRSLGPPIVGPCVGWAKPVPGCDPWLRRGGFETRPYMQRPGLTARARPPVGTLPFLRANLSFPRRPLGLSCPASSGASSNPRRAR
jgi:hypothetical protein